MNWHLIKWNQILSDVSHNSCVLCNSVKKKCKYILLYYIYFFYMIYFKTDCPVLHPMDVGDYIYIVYNNVKLS